ncbi:MAG: efflux RND transporter permease subunit, partial [Bacteroidota bacterium]
MLKNLLHRPVALLLTTLALLLLGILAAGRLPLSLLPEVGIPRISVQVAYPNAAARTLENAVVSPLRNTLLQVNDLSGIRSRARDESAVFYLDFPFGTDPDLAFIEVNEKIDQAMNQLPREVARPRVLATDVSDIPVVQLSVTLRDTSRTDARGTALLELSELARNVLRRRLEQLAEVAFADLSGQREPRLVVRPRTATLRALGLTDDDLTSLLRSANVELGGLLLADGHYEYAVRFTGDLRTAADLRQLYLRLDNNRTVPLSDLATVTYEATPARGAYYHDGHPGVVFTLRKRADARLFDLRENLQILLADLESEYPSLRFRLDNDQTAILRASIDNLTGGLLYGAGFAILILFAFFREWRRPLLIGLAVPTALTVAVLGFYLAGLSINVISLAGLILGLGLMI